MFDNNFKDWEGNPVERNKYDYPYSYNPYVIFQKSKKYKNTAYSDRLFQWDYEKFNKFHEKHFGNKGQYFDENSEKIEAFLKDYYNNDQLELIGIMEGCNMSSGYPYWIFLFNN